MAKRGQNRRGQNINQPPVSQRPSDVTRILPAPGSDHIYAESINNNPPDDFVGYENATDVNAALAASTKRKNLPSDLQSQENWKEMQHSEIELSIACRELLDADAFSKSDPIAVMFTQDMKTKEWVEYGRTEMIRDTLNPDFVKKFVIDHYFEKKQRLRFDIYDIDSKSPSLDKHDFLGRVVCTLGQIIGSRSNKYEAPLKIRSKAKGRIIIAAEELSSSKDMIHMKWSGKKLDKKDFFGKSDPFLLFWRCNEDRSFTICHKTEVIKNTLNPTWKEIAIQSRSLCNGDPERTIKVEVYDWNRGGGHDLIGEFKTSVRRLRRGPGAENTYECRHPEKVKKKRYQHSGHIRLLDFRIDKEPTFFEYIRHGTKMSFVVGIDLTSSNGNPHLPGSLHYIDPKQPNQYTLAIQAVGEIIEDYDSDKLFPAYGFGAKLPPDGEISHFFPINLNQKDPNCNGIKGVLEAYQTCLKKIALHEPTNFSPIIRSVTEMAAKVSDGSEYFVLLLITDGVITDMEATKEEIVKAAKYPISIIIVGVGNDEFDAMEELDGDTVRLSNRGIDAERDIVQFVPMRNHFGATKDHVISQSKLAKDVLKNIPDQVVDFMRSRNFHPQKTTYEESTSFAVGIDLTSSKSNPESSRYINPEQPNQYLLENHQIDTDALPAVNPKRANKIPSETKSVKIGKDGDEIEVGGSFIRFEPGTFNDIETITVTARLDPGEWPSGREAVTSTLDIRAKNLQKKATVRLHTWLVADIEYIDVDIMCYKKRIKKWEVFTNSTVGDSGFIEFQSHHFCSWIAVLRNAFFKTYRLRPIISFKSRDFVLALVLDEPLTIEQLLKDLKEDYGHDLKTRKLNPTTCTKEKKVECCIEALPDHFQFLDSATFTHNVKSIIDDHAMSYFNCQLECNSDFPASNSQEMVPRTIRISLKVHGNQLRTPDCFSYEQSQSDKGILNVGGDVHVGGDLSMNNNIHKDDFSSAAVGTVNNGTLNSSQGNCSGSINA